MINNVQVDELPEILQPAVIRLKEIAATAALPTIFDFVSDEQHARFIDRGYGVHAWDRSEQSTIKDFIKAANYDRGRINEPQYQARLREADGDPNRRNLTTMQYAYRAKLLNTVLEYHMKLSDLVSLLSESGKLIDLVMKNIEQVNASQREFLVAGCVELSALAREAKLNLGICLKYVDGVQGMPWYAPYEAMQEIFKDQALSRPTFGARAYDFGFIVLANPEDGLETLLRDAVLAVQKTWWSHHNAFSNMRAAKSKLNRRQYQSRLDNASVRGETDLFGQIVEEQKIKEAEYYRAAVEARFWQKEIARVADVLEPLVRNAFRQVGALCANFDFTPMQSHAPGEIAEKSPEALALHVAMNNCISARKWLVEAQDKYDGNRSQEAEVDEVITGFDPSSIL